MIVRPILLLVCLALAGCSGKVSPSGSTTEVMGLATIRTLSSAVLSRKAAPAPNSADTLTRAQLAGITDPLIRTRTVKTGQRSLLYVAQRNGAAETWFSPHKAGVIIKSGLIVRTINLGNDLYAVDDPAMLAVLQGRGALGQARRVQSRLDGTNAVVVESYDCVIADRGVKTITVLSQSFRTRHFTQTCNNPSQSFANDFWLDSKGVVRASRQWIGADYGYLATERLID